MIFSKSRKCNWNMLAKKERKLKTPGSRLVGPSKQPAGRRDDEQRRRAGMLSVAAPSLYFLLIYVIRMLHTAIHRGGGVPWVAFSFIISRSIQGGVREEEIRYSKYS